jgi:hypothetical protein
MMTAFDTSEFLEKVKIKGSIPEGRYEDQEILNIAYDVLLSQMVPLILSLKEEYYVTSNSQSITANTKNYLIPDRAYGLQLREVKKLAGTQVVDLVRLDPSEILTTAVGSPDSFYLQGDEVILYPTPSTSVDSLLLTYFITPSKPVLTTDVAQITAIASGVVTASIPSTFTTALAYDFVSKRNGHKCLALDLSASAVTSSSITFNTSDIPSQLTVGDYVCLSKESPFLQVPDAGFGLMVQLTANEVLEDMGDLQALQAGMSKAGELKGAFVQVLSNRIEGAAKRTRIRI